MSENPNRSTADEALARLLAIEEIKALKYRYWRACDSKDVAGFRSCFVTHGAHVDLGTVGDFDDADAAAAAFESLALRRHEGAYVVHDMHHGLHPMITVDGAEASGRWTLRFRQVNTVERYEVVSTGEYDDRYVLEDGEWRIKESLFTPLWGMRTPLADDAQVGAVGVRQR